MSVVICFVCTVARRCMSFGTATASAAAAAQDHSHDHSPRQDHSHQHRHAYGHSHPQPQAYGFISMPASLSGHFSRMSAPIPHRQAAETTVASAPALGHPTNAGQASSCNLRNVCCPCACQEEEGALGPMCGQCTVISPRVGDF